MTDTAREMASPGVSVRKPGVLLSFIAASAIAACGINGPGVEGPQAQALFEQYSATWVLDTLASDPAPEPPDFLPARGGGGPFGGGRSRGGMGPPAGRVGGRGGGMGGVARRDMEAVRHMTSLARHRPARITLMVDDSVFAVAPSSGIRVEVPTDGEEVEVAAASRPIRAKVQWSDLQPSLERSVEGAGRIVDHFEVVDGTRMILTRTVEMGPGRNLRFVFAYDREGR